MRERERQSSLENWRSKKTLLLCVQVLKLLETLRLYADLLRDVTDALTHPETSSAGAELAAYGCGPVCVRIASPAAAMKRAEGEREVLICGE